MNIIYYILYIHVCIYFIDILKLSEDMFTGILESYPNYVTVSVVYWLACSPEVWQIGCSSPSQIKPKTIKWYLLLLRYAHSINEKTVWLGISIMCPSGANYVFSQNYKDPAKPLNLVQSGHDLVECNGSHHDIAEKVLIWY